MMPRISSVLFAFVLLLASIYNSGGSSDGETWNELVFTQMWGYSSCLQFREETKDEYQCRYEGRPSIWSIHGIWPSLAGTKGPNFCTKVKFDEHELAPIEDQLNQYWYEINSEKEGAHFWSHEWTKHGSCAKELPQMGNELKYFQTGLQLRNQYDLYSILKDGGIVPQGSAAGYKLGDIVGAIQQTLKVVPYIECYEKKEEGEHVFYLLAIELCLNRSFEPIDCSHSNHLGGYQLNGLYGATVRCPEDANIIYTDKSPTVQQEEL